MCSSILNHFKNQSGSAVTELALLSLILIPLLLYAFFAGEAGRVILLMQEEVIASIWDFASYPYNFEKTHERANIAQEFSKNIIEDHNPISTFNRVQYIDEDSAFTNEARTSSREAAKGLSSGQAPEKYITNGFVVGTHCDSNQCGNKLYDFERPSNEDMKKGYQTYKGGVSASDDISHEVFCGIYKDAGNAGNFVISRYISTLDISKDSPGGLAICQAKARLKNYLIPSGKFFPDFYGDDFSLGATDFKGETMKRYDGSKKVIDNVAYSGDIIVRHRAALLTDSWNLSEHDDIKMFNNFNDVLSVSFYSGDERFKSQVNKIVQTTNILGPTEKVLAYSRAAKNANIANVPTTVDTVINPTITRTNMIAVYPHDGNYDNNEKKLKKYSFDPIYGKSGVSGLLSGLFKKNKPHFTTPLYNGDKAKYVDVFNDRGVYYMGSKQSQAQSN